MDSNLRSFRNLTPMESHGIRTIAYSAAGDMVLIAAGNAQVRRLSQFSGIWAPFSAMLIVAYKQRCHQQ